MTGEISSSSPAGTVPKTDRGTCSRCRRHRRVEAYTHTGRPLCRACHGPEPSIYSCPDCSKPVLGKGTAVCFECAAIRRADRRIKINVELFEQTWVQALFKDFCISNRIRRDKGNITAQIDRYAAIFARIDKEILNKDELTQEKLFKIFGADGLRRAFNVIGYLCEQAGVRWSTQELEMLTERHRWKSFVAACEGCTWYDDIVRYCTALTNEDVKSRSDRTIRLYLTAAVGFLRHAGIIDVRELTQQHLEGYLRGTPGQAASLYSFVTHLNAEFDLGLIGRQSRRTPIKAAEKRMRAELVGTLTALEQTANPLKRLALVIEAISQIYQIPLKSIIELTHEQIEVCNGQVRLQFDLFEVYLEHNLGNIFLQYIDHNHPKLAFPGRNNVQALTTSVIRYHKRRANI